MLEINHDCIAFAAQTPLVPLSDKPSTNVVPVRLVTEDVGLLNDKRRHPSDIGMTPELFSEFTDDISIGDKSIQVRISHLQAP
jgi:hypothetical protein